MSIDKYFVVRHEGEWTVKHNGRYSIPYRTQKEAIQGALSRARRTEGHGKNAQVLVQNTNHTFRTEWTYGDDPYPLKG
jgi:Uncharacterized protein conserved in bacteria (DUF2188)